MLAEIHTGGTEEEAPAAASGAAGTDTAGTAAAAAAGAQAPLQRGGAAALSFAAGGVQAGSSSEDEQAGEGKVLTSPAVRHLAKQYGINLRKVGASATQGQQGVAVQLVRLVGWGVCACCWA